jgi:hypothetical protein
MEYWLLCKDVTYIKFFINDESYYKTIIPRFQYHSSIIPEFQHSSRGEDYRVRRQTGV